VLNASLLCRYIEPVIVTRQDLEQRLRARMDRTQSDWWTEALERAAQGTTSDLLRVYTGASRVLGGVPLGTDNALLDDNPVAHWTLEDIGRLLLLLGRHDRLKGDASFESDAITCYEQGDTREQQSWMRTVAWLPECERYLAVVIDTCRTNIQPLFQAVACENPYPARYFPERNFNQMVLKALFNNVALARIRGLDQRRNSELARMASDYAAERRAAGRSVPTDIGLAIAAPTSQRNDS
jgi:hypothetical protein